VVVSEAYHTAEDGGELFEQVLVYALGVGEDEPIVVTELVGVATIPDVGVALLVGCGVRAREVLLKELLSEHATTSGTNGERLNERQETESEHNQEDRAVLSGEESA
jgi:hypothetical protein